MSLKYMDVDKTWGRPYDLGHGVGHGLPHGIPFGLLCGLPVVRFYIIFIFLFFLTKAS